VATKKKEHARRKSWGGFCGKLADELGIARKWITHKVYTPKDDLGIVRFDFFKGKPFEFTVGIENSLRILLGGPRSLADAVRFLVIEGLETKQPPKTRCFTF